MFKNQKAFTLIELLVTVCVLGVLLSLAVPSFRSQIVNNRSVSNAEELADALKYARAEAMKTSNTITLCPLDNKDSATEADDVCGSDWSKGWLVVRDTAAAVADAPVVANGDAILRRWATTGTKMQYNFTPARTFVRFAALGVLSRDKGTSNAVIRAHFEKCKGNAARTITVGLSGMIRVEATACSAL